MMNLEQQVFNLWEDYYRDFHWSRSIWMQRSKEARVDYGRSDIHIEARRTCSLIRNNLVIALVSPSAYVRTIAELISNES